MSNMGSSVTYTRNPGETTEWEDILRKKGIIGPSEEEIQRMAAEEVEKMAEEAKENIDELEYKTLKELDELEEDDEDFGDSRILDSYREKRLAEMKAKAASNKFGRVYPLSRADFVKEVTEASNDSWVICYLWQEHIENSQLLNPIILRLASKFPSVKFMSIRADQCIENYPDRNVPTLLLYHEGECKHRIVGIDDFGGKRMTADKVEWVLSRKGVFQTELEDSPFEKNSLSGGSSRFTKRYGSDSEED